MASSSSDDKTKYRSVRPETVPKNDNGDALVDLYVHLPSSKKYVKWVPKGDPVDPSHVHKIKSHVDPNFYAEEDVAPSATDSSAGDTEQALSPTEKFSENSRGLGQKIVIEGSRESYESARLVLNNKPKSDAPEDEPMHIESAKHLDSIRQLFGPKKTEALSEPIDEELKNIFRDIGTSKPGNFSLQDSNLEKLSEKICSIVSPEVGDVRSHLRNIPAFVSIMDESSAISTLAILFAIAQGQKTRGVFKDLSYACLLMDISLVGAPDDLKNRWIQNPDQMSEADRLLFEAHPRKSQATVMEKFKNLPEIVGQMILGHHELFSGRGFPRKVRSDLLPPVVRVLAFAVDVHYQMKRAEFRGENASIESIIESFMDPKIEPHLRRHNIDLCRKILRYSVEGDPE